MPPIRPLNKKIRTISQSESVRIFYFFQSGPSASRGTNKEQETEGKTDQDPIKNVGIPTGKFKGLLKTSSFLTAPEALLRLDVNVHLREGNLNVFFAQRGINPLIQRKIDRPIILLFRPDTKHKGK